MAVPESTASPGEVYAVFVEARGWAMSASKRTLNRRIRRIRRRGMLGDLDRARIKALAGELAQRREPVVW